MDTITKEMVAEELDLKKLEALIFIPWDKRFNSVFIVCDKDTEAKLMAQISDKAIRSFRWKIIRFYRWEEMKNLPWKLEFSYYLNSLTRDKSLGKVYASWGTPSHIIDTKKKGIRAF